MNAVGLRLIGASNESDIMGKAYLDCVSADDRQRVSRLLEASFNGVPAEFEFVSSVHDPPRVLAASLVPLRNNDGGVVRVMGVAQDITEQKEAERQQKLMLQELNHRVKNNLAAVISISQQTAEQVESVPEFETALNGRLRSMAIAHEMLAEARWEGVQLVDMLARILDPYRQDDASRIVLAGPAIMLPASVATPVCMVVHELAVNAVKYGSLSNIAGRVDVRWELEQVEGPTRQLTLSWEETGGPPVAMPSRSGRGTMLIERMVNYQLHGEATIDFEPTGVRCRMTVPLDDGNPTAGTECTP
jgi:PAS domain S-box-containing protein